ITVVKEINEPRLESLKGKMRAKKYEPVVFDLKAIEGDETKVGLKNSPTRVKQTWSAKRQPGKAEMLTGEPDEIAEKLIGKLKEIGYLK
ncbi:MAG TPA: electron transfer flavoprotein subunit beta, partial [Candidatus Goldiibacteriota bacterium]|nr:electron transfer flavoprotein subunit beta [Candidatus Goldiibacteriota bacterium]